MAGADFTMGNVDRSGSRSLPGNTQGDLSKKNVEKHGLAVRWTAATDDAVAGAAVTSGNKVLVGDLSGHMYAFDRDDGSLVWKTCVEAACPGPFFFSGILGSPLANGNTVYAGTLSGSLVALDIKTGELLWTHTPLVTPTVFGLPIDSV